MQDYLTVGDIVKRVEAEYGIQISPRFVSDLFYQRKLDVNRCRLLSGRRLIAADYAPEVVRHVRDYVQGRQTPKTAK